MEMDWKSTDCGNKSELIVDVSVTVSTIQEARN